MLMLCAYMIQSWILNTFWWTCSNNDYDENLINYECVIWNNVIFVSPILFFPSNVIGFYNVSLWINFWKNTLIFTLETVLVTVFSFQVTRIFIWLNKIKININILDCKTKSRFLIINSFYSHIEWFKPPLIKWMLLIIIKVKMLFYQQRNMFPSKDNNICHIL